MIRMNRDIQVYNDDQKDSYKTICDILAGLIDQNLPESESKIWHRHPVWFIDGNPITGYSIQNPGVRLMFWSGADFGEEGLNVRGKKFRDASVFYRDAAEINTAELQRWLEKSRKIQWDYQNIIKNKGLIKRIN
jgi:hypothetical protein